MISPDPRHVYSDANALAAAAADAVAQAARLAVAERGIFTIALAGGSTPKKLYLLLATDPQYADFPWDKTEFFFGDERHVPPDHAESNYLMAEQTLFSGGQVPPQHIHRIRGELPDASDAAELYETELRSTFARGLEQRDGIPRFDLILLGMGPDGHTASLFPGTSALAETHRLIVATWVEKFKTHRITCTFPLLNHAAKIYLCVGGADKTEMIHEVLDTRADETAYPVQQVRPIRGEKIWLLDQLAAAKIS